MISDSIIGDATITYATISTLHCVTVRYYSMPISDTQLCNYEEKKGDVVVYE